MIVDIQTTLIDPEQILRLRRVINREGRPLGYGAALDHLSKARGYDVVFGSNAVVLAVAINPVEPTLNTLEKRESFSVGLNICAPNRDVCCSRLFEHSIHIDEDVVGLVFLRQTRNLSPEFRRFIPISGTKSCSCILPGARVPSKSYAIASGISFLDISYLSI